MCWWNKTSHVIVQPKADASETSSVSKTLDCSSTMTKHVAQDDFSAHICHYVRIFINLSRTCTSKFLGIMWLIVLTHYGKRSRKLQYFDIFHFSPSYSLDNVCCKIYFGKCIQQLSCDLQNGLLFLADFKFRRYLFSVVPTPYTLNRLLTHSGRGF